MTRTVFAWQWSSEAIVRADSETSWRTGSFEPSPQIDRTRPRHHRSGRSGLAHQHPRNEPPAIRDIATRVAEADAFVFITPEYNHSYPASIKAFIDHHVEEWSGKAVGFVSYGGIAGGLRSVEALRLVFASLNAATVRNTVSFANAWNQFVDGVPVYEGANAAAESLVNQIKWWGHALRQARRGAPSLLTGQE